MKPDFSLNLITDRTGIDLPEFYRIIDEAIEGGVTSVQLREKKASDAEIYAIGSELLKRLRPKGIPLIINDRADIALILKADGVHLGQTDGCVKQVRECLGPDAIIGQSIETWEQALAAQKLPLDYIVASPVFASLTKLDTAKPWGLEGISRLKSISKTPVLAIGGIHTGNAQLVVQAGAQGICVVSAIMQSLDPRSIANELKSVTYN